MINHISKRIRPLNILHVASHNTIKAGGAIQMQRLAIGLKQRGHDVTCAFNIKPEDSVPGHGTFNTLRKAGIEIYSFPMQRLHKYPGMVQFRKFLSLHKFDVIHTHRFRALKFVCMASTGLRVPALLGNKKNSFAVPSSWARVYGKQKVDRIIVNAEYIKQLLIETGKVNPEKVAIVYNGVDLDTFHPHVDGTPVRERFGIDKDVPLFGMIANFARKKSHDIFFEAAQKVIRKAPEVRFLLAGGGDYNRYEELMRRKGLSRHFVFAGFCTDVASIIASLDFSVISSRKGEGLTGSLVESMAMAKPVISTDVAGNAEIIRHRQTGILIPAGRADMLAEAMLYLLNHRDEAEQMGKQAYDSVRDKVDNAKRTLRIEGIYYDILEAKGVVQKNNKP